MRKVPSKRNILYRLVRGARDKRGGEGIGEREENGADYTQVKGTKEKRGWGWRIGEQVEKEGRE